jgi:hypothetical protein
MKISHLFVLSGIVLPILTQCSPDRQQATSIEDTNQVIASNRQDMPLSVELQGKKVTLKYSLEGGAMTAVQFNENGLNPLTWKLLPEQMPETIKKKSNHIFQGHFLCLGRWGQPSPQEADAGIVHNGEINTLLWRIAEKPSNVNYFVKSILHCVSPEEYMTVKRHIFLSDTGSFFFVREEFVNDLPLGRITNMVQHVTIGEPFLDENTLIDCNAGLGYDQATPLAEIEKKAFRWGTNVTMEKGNKVNLRLTTDTNGYCTSHIFDKATEYGWITATNPAKGLLLGYVWKTKEYPWLNVWHHFDNWKPVAHGLEFGTTGFGGDGKDNGALVKKCVRFFGQLPFEYLEAKQTSVKSYCGFLLKVPETYEGVKSILYADGKLIVEGINAARADTLYIGDWR